MVKAIVTDMVALGHLEPNASDHHMWMHTDLIDEPRLKIHAKKICTDRGYPASMANRNVEKLSLTKYLERIQNATTYMDSGFQQRYWA